MSFVFIALVAVNLAFIWGNSLQTAEKSSEESQRVEEIVEPVLEKVEQAGVQVERSYLVRKTAHFVEFCLLGVLSYLAFRTPGLRRAVLWSELLCLGAAAIDETIQIFSEGRGPGMQDVALDFCGATVGVFVCLGIVCLVCLLKNKN